MRVRVVASEIASRRAPLVAARGVGVALRVAVLAGIGIDDAAHRAALGRHLGLDAAPRAAVAGDHDLSLHVHAAQRELVVVGGDAVVHVDQLAGGVAVRGVRVVGGELLVLLARGAVAGDGGLVEAGREARGRDHLQRALARDGEEDLVFLDARVVAPGAEEAGDEVGVGLAPRRAEVVRTRGDALHPGGEVPGVEQRVEARLEGGLRGEALGGEADGSGRDIGAVDPIAGRRGRRGFGGGRGASSPVGRQGQDGDQREREISGAGQGHGRRLYQTGEGQLAPLPGRTCPGASSEGGVPGAGRAGGAVPSLM